VYIYMYISMDLAVQVLGKNTALKYPRLARVDINRHPHCATNTEHCSKCGAPAPYNEATTGAERKGGSRLDLYTMERYLTPEVLLHS
jgi:hypothetical protein